MPPVRVTAATLALSACLAAPCWAQASGDDDFDLGRAFQAEGPARSPSDEVTNPAPPSNSSDERDANRRLAAPPTKAPSSSNPAIPKLLDVNWSQVPVNSLGAVAAALAIVIGLFLLLVTFLKKAAPRSHRALPGDVVTVLGRTPLSGKQVVHLVKLGSKLVLVSLTPERVAPIAEVTDPEEVTRLLGLCEQQSEHSASAAFHDVFDRLTREPSSPGFLDADAGMVDRQQLAAAYSNTPGGRAHA